MNRQRLQLMELRPSPRLALVLLAAHLGALALLVTLPVALWWLFGGAALLLLSALRSITHYALRRSSGSVQALEFADRTQLRVRTCDGAWHSGCILGNSTVGVALLVLNIRIEDQRWPAHVVITGDSLDAEDLRRLRVWLRWGPLPQDQEAAVS
jgi:toxin CptA